MSQHCSHHIRRQHTMHPSTARRVCDITLVNKAFHQLTPTCPLCPVEKTLWPGVSRIYNSTFWELSISTEAVYSCVVVVCSKKCHRLATQLRVHKRTMSYCVARSTPPEEKHCASADFPTVLSPALDDDTGNAWKNTEIARTKEEDCLP